MRVCDRHHDAPAKGTIVIETTDEHYDLCDQCLYQIKEFIGDCSRELTPKTSSRKRSK